VVAKAEERRRCREIVTGEVLRPIDLQQLDEVSPTELGERFDVPIRSSCEAFGVRVKPSFS
jgi:hypothetical protein